MRHAWIDKKIHAKSARKFLTGLVPAPTAGTEWKFRMVIRYGDVIGVQSNAMEKEENRMVKQKGEK